MRIKTICAGIGALALIGGLAACGSSGGGSAAAPIVTQAIAPAPVVTVTDSPPQVIINQNNNAPPPVPAQTVYVPAPAYAQANPWSVAVAYTNDVNTPGGNWAAWSLLGPAVQAGWNSDYNTFVDWADPTSFKNLTYVSESGDSVTFTFDLTNGSTGSDTPYSCTFTVNSGIITSSASFQI
jgi:hypothetical protein